MIDRANAFMPLTSDELDTAGQHHSAHDRNILRVASVPDDAPPVPQHPKFGKASKCWAYCDAEGRIIGHVYRFEREDCEFR